MRSTATCKDHTRARGANYCRWCMESLGPREDRLPDFDGAGRPQLLGAYRAWLEFGGHEEGGWWVTQYEHLASIIVREDDDLPKLARQLWDIYAEHDDGRRVSDSDADTAVFVLCEDKPKQHEQLGVGHYE